MDSTNKLDADGWPKRLPHECPDCKLTPMHVYNHGREVIRQLFDDEPETFLMIDRAVNYHQVLLNIAKNLDYGRHGKFDPNCEVCETIALAEGKKENSNG